MGSACLKPLRGSWHVLYSLCDWESSGRLSRTSLSGGNGGVRAEWRHSTPGKPIVFAPKQRSVKIGGFQNWLQSHVPASDDDAFSRSLFKPRPSNPRPSWRVRLPILVAPMIKCAAMSFRSLQWLFRRRRPSVDGHDFLGPTIAAVVSLTGDRVHPQLTPGPSTGTGRLTARTIQDPLFGESLHQRHQVGSVRVGTKPNQISSKAPRTLNAMTNTRCHGTDQPDRAVCPS